MNRVVALAIVVSLATISLPASAKPAVNMPPGPAAQAILQWFTTDRSLGCSNQQCALIDSSASFEVYYGDLSGGGPKADALAFVCYGPYLTDGGNAVALAAAYFHRDGGSYRFVKTFTDSFGSSDITGTDVKFLRVQFLPGKASITAEGVGGNGPRLADYTVTLNPAPLTLPVVGNVQGTPYHAPQTPAELALNNVLNLDMTVPGPLSYSMATKTGPWANPQQTQYTTLFTQALSLAVYNANIAVVKQNCPDGPDAPGAPGVCDLDFDPLLCAQDTPPAPILYRTISSSGNTATVAFEWSPNNTDWGRYRLVKIDGTWKLDGIECLGAADGNYDTSAKFNMSQRVPQFAQFPSPTYRGPFGRVDLSSPNIYQYRTRLRNGAQLPPNFAGHYQLVQWGCGTECSAGAVIDALNGQVTFLPTAVTQGMEAAMDAKFKAVEFRADSRLIVFSGQINETGVLGTHFDLWNGSDFLELLTLPFVPPATEAQQQPVGGTVLPHDAASEEAPAGISPGLIQSWKDYIKDYPEKLAEFQKDQAARRKEAQEVDFPPEEKSMDDVEKSYPFLREEFQQIRNDQKMVAEYNKLHPDHPVDFTPYIHIAESLDKTNLLFVNMTGSYFCGSGGCDTTVYADDGAGYKEAMGAMIMGSVYVTRTSGRIFLYLGSPNIASSVDSVLPVEWILKNSQFVENKPPPREPDDPLYLKWRAFEEQHKKGPAPRVRHYENVDASGNDRGSWIRGVSSAACESICIADSGCAGYTYNRSRATCIPKSIVVRLMGSSEPAVTGVVEGR